MAINPDQNPQPGAVADPDNTAPATAVNRRSWLKTVGRFVGLGAATVATGGTLGVVTAKKTETGPFAAGEKWGPTFTPTMTDLDKKEAAANAKATQVSAEATQVKRTKDMEESAAVVDATKRAEAATKTPTPSPTPRPTNTATPTMTLDERATVTANEQAKADAAATQAVSEKKLVDAKASSTAAADILDAARGTPTRTPTPTATATLNPTAAAQATQQEKLNNFVAQGQAAATVHAMDTATAKAGK